MQASRLEQRLYEDKSSTHSNIDSNLIQVLKKQKYQIIGNHSAVKKCRWLHMSLVEGRPCYKSKFYGIKSHRCVQFTPSAIWCTQGCLHCWRIQTGDSNLSWDESTSEIWDTPSKIVDLSIAGQKKILSGYKSQVLSGKIKSDIYTEALKPKHAAISLAGEPALYPDLGELLSEFHNLGMTTFLVTNGTRPDVLRNLSDEPTQLYISLSASRFKQYQKICRPQSKKYWRNLLETLNLLKSFNCPTAIRLTLVKGLNLEDPLGYAKLISKAEPTYIEPKAYMYIGYSRKRLAFENMPTYKHVQEFSLKLAESTGYRIIDDSAESRVVLLSKLEKPIKVC
ncbi:4-demethylwyosine synthase TYW1 [[Eubacterium] cellulosolvens]